MEPITESYFLIHPYGRLNTLISPLKFVKGEGIYVYDENGQRYINAASGLWNVCLGFGVQSVENAISSQLKILPYSPLFYFTHDPAIELAKQLIKLTRNRFNGVYLTCSGSEGVELAIKTTLVYQGLLQNNKKMIISLEHSYHGTTYAALSASAIESNRSFKMLPRLQGFASVSAPYCYRCSFGKVYPSCKLKCAANIESLFSSQSDNIAALIIEPVLASGGNVVPPEDFFLKIQELCRIYNVVLIVDEVATGIGRCGEMLASDIFNIQPDILILSKGLNAGYLPIGAVLFSERILSVFAKNQAIIPHGSSQDGNPISCKAALATLEYMINTGVVENAKTMGVILLALLRQELCLPFVGDIRGIGLMVSIELVQDRVTKEPLPLTEITDIFVRCVQKGLLVYPFERGISLFPPLIIQRQNVEQIVSILKEVFLESK